jgi:ABC-2 type transport system permease protein
MRALGKLTWIEVKLFVREPIGLFFTLAFPLLLLFLFGAIFGNQPVDEFGGRGTVDISVPGYLDMVIGTLGLIGLPIGLASYRQQGVLRRYRATPLHPAIVLGAQIIFGLATTMVGAGLLIIAAHLAYAVPWPETPLSLAGALVLSSLSFFSVGFTLGSVLPTARTAQAVGMALFFPMLFLSGASGMPRELLPETLRRISDLLPLSYVVTLITDLWYGQGWNSGALLVLIGMLIVGSAVATLTFRWE